MPSATTASTPRRDSKVRVGRGEAIAGVLIRLLAGPGTGGAAEFDLPFAAGDALHGMLRTNLTYFAGCRCILRGK